VDLEERSLDPLLKRRCEECGAELTDREIETSQEAGGPFLCSVHAAEQVPADEVDEEGKG
jgi:hypothetical protein